MSISRSRDLRLLAGAAGISALGDFMAIFPLILHVQQRTGSAFAVSALIFALWGPVVLAAGLAGAIVDRFENRRILIGVSLAQAAIVGAMLACADNLWALLALMALLDLGVALSQPAEFALVPAAAGPKTKAARANGIMETARSIGFTAGPVVGGALGAAGLLWLALALFSMSATAEPFFVTDVLGAGSLAYGILLTSWTLGMAAGASGLAHRVGRTHLATGGLVAVVLQGLGIAGGRAVSGGMDRADRFLVRRRRPRRQERAAPHADPRARPRRAPRSCLRRIQRRSQRCRARSVVLGGIVVGTLGARTALLLAGLGPAAIGAACLLCIRTRHRTDTAAALTTTEGSVVHAHVQG